MYRHTETYRQAYVHKINCVLTTPTIREGKAQEDTEEADSNDNIHAGCPHYKGGYATLLSIASTLQVESGGHHYRGRDSCNSVATGRGSTLKTRHEVPTTGSLVYTNHLFP